MRKNLLMIPAVAILVALSFVLLNFLPASAVWDRCKEPPFLSSGVESNVLVIMDNSGSMGELAYKEAKGQYGTTSAPDEITCEATGPSCDPNCGSNTDQLSCISKSCTNNFGWSCGRNNGQCTFTYKCSWSKQKKTCTRFLLSSWCYAITENDRWRYKLTEGDPWKATIIVQTTNLGNSQDAYYGYDPSKKYYGYFDPDKTYKYDNAKHYFYTQDGWNTVDPQGKGYRGACSSGSCDKFSGNWMNWLCMRRIDIAKKVLTGGRLGGDANDYVLVGTPHTDKDQYKIFRDNGADGVYYTPFRQGFGVYIYSNRDLDQRTNYEGAYVPLIGFFAADFSPDGSLATTPTRGLPLDNFSLGKDNTYGNQGEPKTYDADGTPRRSYDGCYYFAVKHSAVSDKTPPAGVVQDMATKVRLGLMQFNYGQGPAEGFKLGDSPPQPGSAWKEGDCSYGQVLYGNQLLCGFNPNGDNVDAHTNVVRYGDGGHIVNRVGDRSEVASWQTQLSGLPNISGKVPIYTIVKNINETLALTWTPLAETLREAMNYFRQNDPSYRWVDTPGVLQVDFEKDKGGPKDPFYWTDPNGVASGVKPCIKSYIILVTDGEPSQDNPCHSGCTTQGSSSCARNNCDDIKPVDYPNRPSDVPVGSFRFNVNTVPNKWYSNYHDRDGLFLDDIAFKLWTEDNRPETGMDDKQTVSLYTVFLFETDDTAREYLQRAALAGGFTDLSGDGQPGKPYSGGNKPVCGTGNPPVFSNCYTWRDSYLFGGTPRWDGYYEWDTDANLNPDHYFEAQDGYMLEKSLQSIFSQIALGGAAGAVATISQQTKEGDAIIRGAFDAADPTNRSRYLWNGRLEVYWPDSEGDYEFDSDKNIGLFCSQMGANPNCPDGPDSKCCWDAAEKLKALPNAQRSSRKIFTYVKNAPFSTYKKNGLPDPGQIDFTGTNWQYFDGLMRGASSPSRDGVPGPDEIRAIIQWTRGVVNSQGVPLDDSGNPYPGAWRNRKGYILGDIVYSTPVIVGPPPLASVSSADKNLLKTVSGTTVDFQDGASSFWDFRNYWLENPVVTIGGKQYKGRPKIAYVGANDGMLHAFLIARLAKDTGEWDYNCADCKTDLWSYIPSNLLSELQALTKSDYGDTQGSTSCKHRTMVDLSPRAWDVFIKSDECTPIRSACGDAKCWRTIIIGGERGGGDTYFAIDVTEPTNPKVLWEYPVLKNLAVAYESSGTKMALPFRENDNSANTSTCPRSTWPDVAPTPWPNSCFDNMYLSMKTLPMSWTRAALGRVRIPPDVQFWRYVPGSSTPTLETTPAFGDCDNKRHIAFIGTGFQMFDDPATSVDVPDLPAGIPQSVKSVLTKPQLLAIDVETGENYFQVLWPLAVKAKTQATPNLLPDQRIPTSPPGNFIPWAFGNPSLVDVWSNNDRDATSGAPTQEDSFAEDGFVDRMYVGDMHGYLYRMVFNLKDYGSDNSSHNKGVNIESWPTKPIPVAPTSGVEDPTTCDETNNYRGCRQPISVAPAISYDLGSTATADPKIRVLFGTGKFDQVKGAAETGGDDKTDLTKMSFYNLVDRLKSFDCTTDASGNRVCNALPTVDTSTAPAEYSIDNSSYPAVITVSGATPEKGFRISGTNFGFTFGAGACQDDTTTSKYRNYRSCTESTTSCDDATKKRVCGDPPDATCAAECTMTVRNTADCCNWVTPSGGNDCCQGTSCTRDPATSCTGSPAKCTPCWDCIYDFATAGERVIGDPLIAYGLVFFTTYVPDAGPCSAGGRGWLYIMDYRCQPLGGEFSPVTDAFGHTVVNLDNFGAKVDLGQGMPSEPVMDSSGQFVFVQKSDATVVKIGAGGGGAGGGGGSGFRDIQFKGWNRR